ncbi:MAG TPA: NUDIX hydrolase [Ktedonobacterales bacterium]|nr:NUDIX hydrolase [Ktedonobacterales bacterium]
MDGEGGDNVIYRGALLTLLTRRSRGPDGGERLYEVVDHPPAVAVVAVRRRAGQGPAVALVRQPRPAIGGETWELPAGLARVEAAETLEEAARRELREEAGAEGGVWTELGQVYTSPGFTDERVTLFLAEGVEPVAGATPDAREIVSLAWVPLAEAIQRVESDSQADAKTALGLLLARDRIERRTGTEGEGSMFSPESTFPFAAPGAIEDAVRPRDASFRLENLLMQEFNYVSSTAYQALEDRARMFNLYLVLIGALATGVGVITQLGEKLNGYAAEIIVTLLAIMGVVGVAFFIKLIRLRQAWRESAIAMNIIKEHYIQMFQAEDPNVERLFRWRLRTMPSGEKRGSSSFVVCMTVAFLGSLSFAAAALLATANWVAPALASSFPDLADAMGATPWATAIVVALVSYILHQIYFSRVLDRKREDAAVEKAVADAGLPKSILKPPSTKS